MYRNLIKIIIIVLFFSWLNTSIFAIDDVDLIKIYNVQYAGYLSDETIIKINWVNFNNCWKITINNTELKIKDISESEITYIFWNNKIYKWSINIVCEWQTAVSAIEFPYIDSASLNNNYWNWDIKILWWNFINWSTVLFVWWWNLLISSTSNNYFTWKLPDTLETTKIYIEHSWLKSNIFDLWIDIPHITHITAEEWFYKWNKVIIHWENLNNYNNSILEFWDHLIWTKKYNEEDKTFSFILPYLTWLNALSVTSNWISSNIEEIDILWDDPYITSVNSLTERVEVNWYMINREKITIKGDNFPMNDDNFKLYLNWILIYTGSSNVYEISPGNSYNNFKEIIIYNKKLRNWNNYFDIKYNEIQSNIFNLNVSFSQPYISYVNYWDLIDSKRIFEVWIGNFNITEDTLYFNNNIITVKSCLRARCRIELDNNILNGTFYIESWDYFKSIPFNFDFRQEKLHIINEVSFDWDLTVGTKFTIKWENFYNTTLSFSNLAIENTNWRYELEKTSNEISWKIWKWYNVDSMSTINLNKSTSNISLNFVTSNVKNKIVYWYWYISEITSMSNKYLISPWDELKILWKGFHVNDKILINWKEVNFNFINNYNWSFILPINTEAWEYSVELLNASWWKSNWLDILVTEIWFDLELNLLNDDIEFSKLYLSTNYENEKIYWFNFTNRIHELIISDIKFLFTSNNTLDDLWLFSLMLNWKILAKSTVDNNWYLHFEDIIIDEGVNIQKLYILKNSSFINNWLYNISLNKLDIVYRGTSEKFSKILTSSLQSRNFVVFNQKLVSCIDSLIDNSNCNWITDVDIKEDESVEEKDEETLVEKNQVIYERIDDITLDIIDKNSKLILFAQLNAYKNLRYKINNIINKYNNSPNKIYLKYFYIKIDKKYKTTFKEYILSK